MQTILIMSTEDFLLGKTIALHVNWPIQSVLPWVGNETVKSMHLNRSPLCRRRRTPFSSGPVPKAENQSFIHVSSLFPLRLCYDDCTAIQMTSREEGVSGLFYWPHYVASTSHRYIMCPELGELGHIGSYGPLQRHSQAIQFCASIFRTFLFRLLLSLLILLNSYGVHITCYSATWADLIALSVDIALVLCVPGICTLQFWQPSQFLIQDRSRIYLFLLMYLPK